MNVIWCEISCGRCGAAIGDYYSPDWIKKLKAMSKDWTHDDNYRVLCPQCRKELKKNETKFSCGVERRIYKWELLMHMDTMWQAQKIF